MSSQNAPRKPWYRRWWAWVIAAVIVIAAIGNLIGDTDGPDSGPTPPETSASPAIDTPEPEPSDETTEADPGPTETTASAREVETAILEGNGVDSFQGLGATSPGFLISDIEDVSTGTIRVHLQDALTEEEQAETAKWVINMSCTEAPGITTVVTRDTSGIDQNNYARDLNILPACK